MTPAKPSIRWSGGRAVHYSERAREVAFADMHAARDEWLQLVSANAHSEAVEKRFISAWLICQGFVR